MTVKTSSIVLTLMLCSAAFAQSDRGSVTGTVTDPSNAVVAGATVAARNTESGAPYETVTTATGNYTLASVPAGVYDLTVTATGFSRYVQRGIRVQVALTARIDVVLQVGSVSESVSVDAAALLLRTENAEQSHNITGERINNLPVNFGTIAGGYVRSPFAFVNLMPGALQSGQNDLRINGFTNTVQMRFEGQDTTNANSNQRVDELQPSVEAIQEFTLQTSNFAAEFGQVGGGIFNFTAKSGTNAFHGSAYEYFSNEALNAGIPWSDDGAGHLVRPRARKHDFGFSAGGPVYVPRVYNGKNRTFFFANIESYRDKKIASGTFQTVPTEAYRNGDFSAALTGRNLGTDPTGRAILENTVYDPASNQTVNGVIVRTPYPGNIVPRPAMDPVALKIQDLIPKPTRTGLVNNWEQVYPFDKVQAIPSVKIDHSITDRQKVAFYFSRFRTDQYVNPDGLPEPLTQLRILYERNDTWRLNYDYNLSPTMLLHVGIGYIRYRNPDVGVEGVMKYDAVGKLGLNGSAITPSGFPRITNLGANQGGMGPGMGPTNGSLYLNDKPTGIATLTYVRNNHTYKVGADWRIDVWTNRRNVQAIGNYTFNSQQTTLPSTQQFPLTGGSVGFPYASFLLGLVNSATVGAPGDPQYRKTSWSLFLQDTWKVTRRLTLDYGIRWDYQGPAREIHNRVAMFAPTVPNPSAGGLPGATIFEGTGPGRCNCRFTDKYPYAIGPRIGAAYQLNTKTVLRGGWGLTYTATNQFFYLDDTRSLGTGWNTLNFNSSTFAQPALLLRNGMQYNRADLYVASLDPGIRPQAGQINNPPAMMDRSGGRPGRINQWNISLQRQITANLAVEAAYIGNRGVWLQANSMVDFNAVTPERLRMFGLDINNATDRADLRRQMIASQVTARGFRLPYADFPATLPLAQALRPFPQFGNLAPLWAPLGKSWYDALQVKLTKRFSHGLDLSSSFTWQKELDQTSGTNDIFNRINQKTISMSSQPFTLVTGFNYVLPAITHHKAIRLAVGGWTVGGILRYSSGRPIPVPSSNNNLAGLLFRPTRMNRVPGEPLFLVEDLNCRCFDPGRTFVLNPKAWSDPADGQWGFSAPYYSDYRNRRAPDEQLSIGRIFQIRERMRFSIRAEFFNVFNRTVFPAISGNNPAASPSYSPQGLTTAGFGFYNTSTAGNVQTGGIIPTSRNGQLVARFEW